MDYSEKWEILDTLGEGGQGKVFLVIPKPKGDTLYTDLSQAIRQVATFGGSDTFQREFEKSILTLIERKNPSNQKALKVLHKPEDARDYELAEERIRREIKAMSEATHPNLLKIIEYDLDSKWFVSEYHPKKTISNSENRDLFAGDFARALKAFRPLVEGVAELHKKKLVHRDIKPENVFIGSNNNLILGDFGLIFFMDDEKTRISKPQENVGSRDWMPAWAQTIRLEEIRPTFDVFSLGKLLWSLVSGQPKLRLWYFNKLEFNVEKLFPNQRYIKLANPLFKKCIVEEEVDCLPDASALLDEVDKVLQIIENNADQLDLNANRTCKVCGIGNYELVVNEDYNATCSFGLAGNRKWKIFTCSNCGNVQLFSYIKTPKAWLKD